jgi:SAM-dependent methyltransferase
MNFTYRYLDPDEILAADAFKVVEAFLHGTGRTNIGWHYIVDLTWIYMEALKWPSGARVLDAGGGRGPAQFMLAEMGFDIVNVDLVHTQPDYAYHRRYGIQKDTLASYAETRYVGHILGFGRYWQFLKRARKAVLESPLLRESTAAAYAARHERWREMYGFATQKVGKIEWMAGNLCNVPELESGSFDAVVSLSSLEHIPFDILPAALTEIRRLVRPDGYCAITTSATERAETWYHEPSLGYCFSESDLQGVFSARPADTSNPADTLKKYLSSRYLKDNLAPHYRLSGKNGMPWGRWNPTYIPVGITDHSSQ